MNRDYLLADFLDLFDFIINDKNIEKLSDCIDYMNDVKAYHNYAKNLSVNLTDISCSDLIKFINPILKQDIQRKNIGKNDSNNFVVQQKNRINQTLKNEKNISNTSFESSKNNREQWLINHARINPEVLCLFLVN